MPRDIKTRFTIEGEQQYRQSMRDAANAVKVLNSEQKLAAAQFKNTGNAEKYAADQARILQEKIKQQEQAVKAAEKALKELSDDGVSKNSKRWQEWQTRLNNAQTTLVNMETELNGLGSTMDNTSAKADGLTDSIGGISKKLSLQNITSGLKSIDDTLSSAARSALEIGKNLVSSVTEGASWADDLLTNSLIYGIDQDTLQKWSRAATHFDTTVEAMVKSRQKLAQNMKYGSDDVLSGFAELGVNIYDKVLAGGKGETVERTLRKTEDVLWDVGEAIAKLDRDDPNTEGLAMKLLGRNWADLLPLFTKGRQAYEDFMEKQSTVDKETVQNMADANEALDALRYEWSVTLHQLEGSMAPALEGVSNILQGVLKEFNDYLATEEGQQKMQELSDAVTSLFEGLKDIKPGDVIDTAKDILTGIVDALKWISENWTTVETGIKAIGVAWGAIKVTKGVTTFLNLIDGIKGLSAGSVAASAGASAGSGWGASFASAASAAISAVPWLAVALAAAVPMVKEVEEAGGIEAVVEHGIEEGENTIDMFKAQFFGDSDAAQRVWDRKVAELKALQERTGVDLTLKGKSAEKFPDDPNSLYRSQIKKLDENLKILEENGIEIPADLTLQDKYKEAQKLVEELGTIQVPVELVPTSSMNATYWWGRRPVGGGGGAYYVEDAEQREGFANGLSFVPYDGYPAILHKGERVLTAAANRNYTYNSNNYFGQVNLNNGMEIDALSESIARQNRRQNAGYGT